MLMRRALLMLACLATNGCIGFEPTGPVLETSLPQAPQTSPASPAPDAKRFAELATAASATAKITGALEVSAVRPTHDSQWGDWMFCIRSSSPDQPLKYAVLVGHDAVLEVRTSVLIDGCGQETYHLLTPAKRGKATVKK
jgi:hypothetical protein